jgi:Calcineurin-like phosphoesterase
MKIQLLSDLHLETEAFEAQPHPQADLLVLAGDIDSTWDGLARFAGWPVPALMVAGNHEFDDRELDDAWPALRARCTALGIRLLERDAIVLNAPDGRRVRFVGTVRWSDFDVFGPTRQASALRAGSYFQRVMGATQGGAPFDALAVRREALACRAWLADALAEPAQGRWDLTVAVTHFAPSLKSADPRYGAQSGTASFCNADDDLLPGAALWLHGHLHCRHDYTVDHGDGRRTRIVCAARGLADKGEADGYDPARLIEL